MNQWAGAILVTTDNKIILQQRTDQPNMVNPGMIAFFGGMVEPGETSIQAAIRELHEETELTFSESDLTLLNVYQKRQPLDDVDCDCYVYIARDIDISQITVHEGIGHVLHTPDEPLPANTTRVTKQAIQDFLKI